MNSVRVPGIPIHGPAKPEVQSIEVGINRVYAAFALNQILVFDDLHGIPRLCYSCKPTSR